jgi:xylulokinase
MGCTLACAASLDFWIKNTLQTDDYNGELENCAILPQNDILFLPYLSGERSPINDPNAKGVFYGLQLAHTRADWTKAVVEGICFALKDCLNEMIRLGIVPKIATVIGGLSQSPWVLKTLATILNLDIYSLDASQGGAFGAAILAMVGDGVYTNVVQACKQLVVLNSKIEPNQTQTEFYSNKFLQYKQLYKKIK